MCHGSLCMVGLSEYVPHIRHQCLMEACAQADTYIYIATIQVPQGMTTTALAAELQAEVNNGDLQVSAGPEEALHMTCICQLPNPLAALPCSSPALASSSSDAMLTSTACVRTSLRISEHCAISSACASL